MRPDLMRDLWQAIVIQGGRVLILAVFVVAFVFVIRWFASRGQS